MMYIFMTTQRPPLGFKCHNVYKHVHSLSEWEFRLCTYTYALFELWIVILRSRMYHQNKKRTLREKAL